MIKKKQYNKKVEINYVGDLTDIFYITNELII